MGYLTIVRMDKKCREIEKNLMYNNVGGNYGFK